MKRHNLTARILTLALSFAMLLQSGFVMPAFADDVTFDYIYFYNEVISGSDHVTESYPIIMPDEAVEPHGLSTQYGDGVVGRALPQSPAEPYRIIGYTFMGWYTLDNDYWWETKYRDEIKSDTVITDDIYTKCATQNILNVHGRWEKYQTADINSDSVVFKAKNANGEYLADIIEVMQTADHTKGFDRDVTDYDLYVYGDTSAVNVKFDQYEPKGTSAVTAGGSAVDVDTVSDITIEDTTNTGYNAWYYDTKTGSQTTGFDFVKDDSVVTGKRYVTEYFDIGDKNTDTTVEITVTLPNTTANTETDDDGVVHILEEAEDVPNTGVSKTYTFHIHRFGRELKLNYGNMPYGEISKRYGNNAAQLASDKAAFDSSYSYSARKYDPIAWQYKGGTESDGDEVKKGYPLTDDADDLHYYNYDKDDTAIAVYSGQKFTDPGVVVYDDDGNEVALSDANVTRKINYTYVPSLKHSDWNTVSETQTITSTLNGTDGENIIDLLEHNGKYEQERKFVKPGIYTIEYSYSADGNGTKIAKYSGDTLRKQTVTRYFIVLPQDGDTNMDTYMSALDSLVYDNVPSAETESDYIYLYRSLDVDHNGSIDEADKNIVLQRQRHQLFYNSISIEADAASAVTEYEPASSESGNKAQLYMDFLGTTEANVKDFTQENDYTQDPETKLQDGTTFYIGYRFKNLNKTDLGGKKVNAITLSVDYDKRYVRPSAQNMATLVSWIKANNENLESVTINDTSSLLNADYTFDYSTAGIYPWASTRDVNTLTVEIYPSGAMTFSDGYILKLPFIVQNVPPDEEDKTDEKITVLSARLDAKGFNMNVSDALSSYMWDMSKTLNSVTADMYDGIIEYMGNCILPFGEEAPAIEIKTTPAATYGTEWSYTENIERNSTVDNLPPGLRYMPQGIITGTPTEAGEFEFRVGGKKYKLTVEKAEMIVHADEKSKIYGELNPELTFTLDSDCFRNAEADKDAVDDADKNLREKLHEDVAAIINVNCDATPNSTVTNQRSSVGKYPIYLTYEDEQKKTIDNYYLTFDDSTLTINKRLIIIDSVTIPSCSKYAFPEDGTSGTARVFGTTESSSTDFRSTHVKEDTNTAETGKAGVLSGDKITVRYEVEYSGSRNDTVGTGKTVNVIGSTFSVDDTDQGVNYAIADIQQNFPSNKGETQEAQITGIELNQDSYSLEYTYGTRLNLNEGHIKISYSDNVAPEDVSFRGATERGLKLKLYYRNNTFSADLTGDYLDADQAGKGYPLKVDESDFKIYVYDPIHEDDYWDLSNSIKVQPMELTLKPDDKLRYYGFDTDDKTAYKLDGTDKKYGRTYTITDGEIITSAKFGTGYNDTQEDIIKNVNYSTTAEKGSDIGDYDLEMTAAAGTNNYTISYEKGTLTIVPRPIKITNIKNIPELTSNYYMNDDDTNKDSIDAIKNVTAIAGNVPDGKTATMTVDSSLNGGLFTNDEGVADAIRVKYDVQYINSNPSTDATVNIENLTMDTDYGDDDYYIKNRNYVVDSTSDSLAPGGVVRKRQITKVEFKEALRTSYTYGDTLNLSQSEDDNTKNNVIHVTYDNLYEEDLTVEEAVQKTDDWEISYSRAIGADTADSKDYKTLQVADTGAVITLKAKSIYITEENKEDFTYTAALDVQPAVLEVKTNNLYTGYGQPIPSFEGESAIRITGFKHGENRSVLTTQPKLYCEDDNHKEIKSGSADKVEAGVYDLVISGAEAANYSFKYTNGQLAVTRHPIIITGIKIDDLTSDLAFNAYKNNKKYTKTIIIEDTATDSNHTLTFRPDGAPITWDGVEDTLKITYTITFTEAPLEGKENVDVEISNVVIDNNYGSARNYYMQDYTSPQKANVIGALIDEIRVVDDPAILKDGNGNIVYDEDNNPKKRVYSYGDYLDTKNSGKCYIHYDSGREIEFYVPFRNLGYYGITAINPYTDQVIEDDEWDKIFMELGEGKKLTFKPIPSLAKDDTVSASTEEFTVVQREVDIIVNDTWYTYGGTYPQGSSYSDTAVENKYTYHFDYDDFAPGEDTLEKALGTGVTADNPGSAAPTLSCVTNEEGTTYPDQTTDAGDYTITVSSVGTSDNYKFVFKKENAGTLTVKKRDITVTSINERVVRDDTEYGTPMLTAALIRQNEVNKLDKISVKGRAYFNHGTNSGTMTAEDVRNGDIVGITFTALYDKSQTGYTTKTDVEIDPDSIKADDSVDENGGAVYPKNKNYNFLVDSSVTPSHFGSVEKQQISEIKIDEDPKLEYNYGQAFKLSGGHIIIKYKNNEDYYEETDFAGLADYDITPTYESTGGEVYNNGRITVIEHNGSRIKLTHINTDNEEIVAYTKGTMLIHPRNMRVVIKPQSYVYGSNPPDLNDGSPIPDIDVNTTALYNYVPGDLVNGDSFTDDSFTDGLEREIPYLSCIAHSRSDAGVYPITGESKVIDDTKLSNYTFVFDTDGEMTVERKPVKIVSIDSGIPVLSSQLIREDNRTTHTLSGSAASDGTDNKMTVTGLEGNDNIAITYDAVYDEVTPSDNVRVKIENIRMNDSYKKSGNYAVSDDSVTEATGGVIQDKEITDVVIAAQPILEYTYGEKLDLDSGRVILTYNDGSSEEVSFKDLPAGVTRLTYADGTTVHDGDVLTVRYHHRNEIILRVISSYNVEPRKTELMTVHKKRLRVQADRVVSTYGDIHDLTWDYVDADADFVNGDLPDSSSFTTGIQLPVITCVDNNGRPVDKTTSVGTYSVILSGGLAYNYEFDYTNSTLTIEKRPIDITSIDSGVPMLTAKFLHENEGPTYRLPASAINTEGQMTVANIANNDTVKVNYTAVYTQGEPADNVTVGIEDVKLEDTYAASANYTLVYTTMSSDHGSINTSDIERAYVKTMPRLEYSYGDRLTLRDGILHLEYDNATSKDVSFTELASLANPYDITLKYAGTDKYVENGEFLTIDDFDGLCMEITVNNSIYNVGTITIDPLVISKRVLNYGTCVVDPITYDGETVSTTGTVRFSNPAGDEVPTATATFEFTDFNAGSNILVNVTDIVLDNEWTHNYELADDNTTAYGTIKKAETEVPGGEIEYEFSTETNTLTVTPFELDEKHAEGGAKYQYSIDGGETWQDSNVFEDIAIGQECDITVRYAETSNYQSSIAHATQKAQAHTARITLISRDAPKEEGEEPQVLTSFYTSVKSAENEDELRAVIGAITEKNEDGEDVTINYYTLTTDSEGKESVVYPLELSGDMNIYATLTAPRRGGGGGGGGKAVPTATPEASESPAPTATPEASATPEPTSTPNTGGVKKNIPYLHGYDGMIKPDDYMTRAEAATIMVILSGDTGEEYENVFPDVGENTWYVGYISQANARGLISGFDDGNFYPEDIVTREQFASMVTRMIGIDPVQGQSFTDVDEDRWSAGRINAAVEKGIIAGYADGTFRPEEPTRRSEAVRMINAATGRIPDKALIDTLTCPYTDLPKDHWAYYEFMIASVEFDIPE